VAVIWKAKMMRMLTNRLTTDEVYRWCEVPWQELEGRDDLKVKLAVRRDRAQMMEEIGNMMADEVAEHNAAGLATTWVLPAGPCDEYDTFVRRVNEERIDCTNLWVFHMDEFLDWQCRPYPLADTYESLEGTMIACFYNRIDEELRPPEDHRIWPRLSNLDYPDEMCDKLGGVDTVWAGIGATGLVAFDEEPRDFWHRVTVDEYAASKTRVVDINSDTMVAMAERSFGTCLDRVPPKGLTIGFHIICSARRAIYMVATGDWKKTVCRILLFSDPTTEYPVTILPKYVPDVTLYTTEYTIDHPMSHETRGW